MQLNSALASVLSGQFLLEESAVPAFLLQTARLLTEGGPGGPRPVPATEQALPVVQAISQDATSVQLRGYLALDDVPAGSVAVTTVAGVMMPYDDYDWDAGFLPGTRTLAARMQQADAHPHICAHVVHLASPGGSTLGLEHFADALLGLTKPVVAYVEMMCSAALWLGSGADRILIARSGIAGSIGTKWDGLDFSKFYEKMGIVAVTVTATDSTDKTRAFDEALKGKPALLRTQLLVPLNNEYQATVKANLPQATADTLTGKLFVGQDAIDNGLADQLGGLQDAIQLAFDLGAEQGYTAPSQPGYYSASLSYSPSITSSTNMGLFDRNKPATPAALATVAALAGKTGLTAETTKAANEELFAAGVTDAALISQSEYQALKAGADRATAAEQKVTDLTAQVGTLTTAKTGLEGKLATAEAEVTRLGALGGANPTTSGKTEGDKVDEPTAHAWFNAGHDHNKEAAALLG